VAPVTPRAAARVLAALGWLAGIALIVDGLPLPAALAVAVVMTAAGLAWVRWGPGAWLALQLRVKLKRAAKTGGSLERA
jgi:hypothetical protein